MRKGITNLLREYYRLKSRTEYDGDYDTAIILADLMSVINSNAMTPRQRQFIALYYFVGLTFEEVALVTGIDLRSVKRTLYDGIRRITDVTFEVSSDFKNRSVEPFENEEYAYCRWLNGIANGSPVGEPSREVVLSIAQVLRKTDEESSEMVRQAETGVIYVDDNVVGDEYTHYSDSQLRWQDRRISLVEEVHPVGDAVGSKRHTPTPDYDGFNDSDDDYLSHSVRTTGRRKIFKLRGN